MSIFEKNQDEVDLRRGNKYFHIARELKRQIDSGTIKTRMPSLSQICEEFQTTPVTAHKAVGLLKKEGVVTSVKGKGTFVTRIRRPRTGVIEAVLHSPLLRKAPAHQAIAEGMQQVAVKSGQRLVINHHMGNPRRALEIVRQAWEDKTVDGFVLWPAEGLDEKCLAVEYLQDNRIPFVLIPEASLRFHKNCHRVGNDDLSVAESLVAHLVRKGHTRIGFAQMPGKKTGYGTIRYEAYEHIMRQSRLTVEPPMVVDADLMQDDPDPQVDLTRIRGVSALFCVTDLVATLICRICLREGIRVPGDLELVGYDNAPESRALGFSSADQNFDQIGERAVEILLDEIEGRLSGPVCEVVSARPVFRQ